MATVTAPPLNRKLLWFGVLLFLLGLITGFATPFMKNPRMGLSSHLEGLMNGMFLILLGIIWPHLRLTVRILGWTGTLALFAAYTNWAATLLAGIWGAGADMMPLAGGDYHGLPWQEILIKFGLISLSVAIVTVCGILLWGLRGKAPQR